MANVTFIITSYWSYGELLIALEFAKNISKHGYKPYFFIPRTHEKIVIESGFPYTVLLKELGKINRILMQDYENTYKPKFVILSDFLNYYFCERHYGLTVDDLKIFSGKLGTINTFEWDLTKRNMDTYGYLAKTVSEVNIDDFGFKLVPCPIADPLLDKNAPANKYYYPLLENSIKWGEEEKLVMRKELKLPIDRPILLLTSATWQQSFKQYPHVVKFVDAVDKAFMTILKRVAEDAQIIYVGAEDFFGEEKAPDNVMVTGKLLPHIFEKYAQASDLFLVRNLTSTTMARLALSGLPCMTISNSRRYMNKESRHLEDVDESTRGFLETLDICYPYRMYPVGWHEFLQPVVDHNPYMNIITEAEIFEIDRTVEKIKSLLQDNNKRKEIKENLRTYKEALDTLKQPYEILDLLARQ